MSCLTEEQILGFLRATMTLEERADCERHLDACHECMELVTLIGTTSIVATVDAPETAAPRELAPGTLVGRYEIVERRGAGGMGTVYAARDAQLDRLVAIKLVSTRYAEDAAFQLGLLREARAMARLTQPNVLTVYDMGTFDGLVYLVAELVEGETLAAWLTTSRPWREVVTAFVQAGRGLEAAHDAGLIHRDFKPANVLVGRDRRVRVFDFGLVRFENTTSPARELVGTPRYMAPEQARGEVADARSDQYSFCRALSEAVVRPPRWLAEITRRGLASDSAERFPTMAALLSAIEHGLGRRRRSAVAGIAVVGMLCATVIGVLAYRRGAEPLDRCPVHSLAGIWDPTREAAAERAVLATGLPYAATNWARARSALANFAARWQGQEREACLAFEVHETDDRTHHDRRVACLEQRVPLFDAIVDRYVHADRALIDQPRPLVSALPDVEACARADTFVGPTDPISSARFSAFLVEDAAVFTLTRSGQIAEASRRSTGLLTMAHVLGSKRAEAEATYAAGYLAMLRVETATAAKLFEAAMWTAEAAGDDALVIAAAVHLIEVGSDKTHLEISVVRQLASAAAERTGSIDDRAHVAQASGTLDLDAGDLDAAEAELEKARRLFESSPQPDRTQIAATLGVLADVYRHRRQLDRAEAIQRRVIDLVAAELGANHPDNAAVLENLANTIGDLGRHAEAAALYDRALAIQESSLGPDSPDVALTLANVSAERAAAGQLVQARQELERALAIYEKTHASPVATASALNNLAALAQLQGNNVETKQLLLRALDLRRTTRGEHHPETIESLLALGELAFAARDVAGARQFCTQAQAAMVGVESPDPELAAEIETCLGELELAAGNPLRAIAPLEHAIALRATIDADPVFAAKTQFALARALPASAAPRARALATAARAGFVAAGATTATETSEVDRWLAVRKP